MKITKKTLLAELQKNKKEADTERREFKRLGDPKHAFYWEGRREGVNDAIIIVKKLKE